MLDTENQTSTSGEADVELPEPEKATEASVENPEAQEKEPVEPEQKPVEKAYVQKEVEDLIAKAVEQAKASVKGGYEGTTKELKSQISSLKKTLSELESQRQEAEWNAVLRGAEESGTNVDYAKRVIEIARTATKRSAELAEREAQLAEREALLNEAGRAKAIADLIKEHGLSEEDAKDLISAESPQAMETIALRKKVARLTQAPSEKPPKTQPKKSGMDFSNMTETQKLGWALEHPDSV